MAIGSALLTEGKPTLSDRLDGSQPATVSPDDGLLPFSESMLQSRNDRAGAPESVRKAAFSVGGQSVLCTDSVVRHDFTFTPAISFFVVCESEEEIRRLSFALSEGGTEFMPLGEYGFSRQFTWVGDRFGISWQLSLD